MALTYSTESGSDEARPSGASSLEYRSLLPSYLGNWCLKLSPTAGEARLTHVPLGALDGQAGAPPRRRRCTAGEPRASNGKRAVGQVRRRVRHGRCAFLWTLTYARARTSRAEVAADVRRFLEDLQGGTPARPGAGPLKIVWVSERGRRGGRLHVHFGVDRWLPHSYVKAVWGRGHVWVGDPGKLPGNPGARQLAAYLAKYVAKELDQVERRLGEHRYGTTQGWTPPDWRRRFHSREDALAWLARVYGQAERTFEYGDPTEGPIWGIWLGYGDGALWPPWDA